MNKMMQDKEMEEYLTLLQKIDEEVYVFGAGKVAKIITELLHGKNIQVKAYLVSDINHNKSELLNRRVISADAKTNKKSVPVLIAVIERGEKKIRTYLERLGYTSIIEVPTTILGFDKWEYKRIRTPVIEVTAQIGCAVNCKYCPQKLLTSRYYEKKKNRQREMSLEEYKKYLNMCPENTIVDFSGFVEPFLVKNSIEMMEYTHKTGHEMTLFTTLRGLSTEKALRVIEMPFQYVCIHMPDKDGYANIPMSDEYYRILEMFIDAKKSNGESFINAANCQSEAAPEILKRTRGKLKIYCEMSDRAGNLDENDSNLTHKIINGSIYCSRAFALNHNVLLPDGSLALCCNDFGLDNIIGNLNEQSYEEIMHGDVLRDIKRAMHIDLDEELICRKCLFAETV